MYFLTGIESWKTLSCLQVLRWQEGEEDKEQQSDWRVQSEGGDGQEEELPGRTVPAEVCQGGQHSCPHSSSHSSTNHWR